jgi:hypothetical protein
MANDHAIQVGEFLFEDAELAQKAVKEQKAINYLRHQLQGRNISAVISAYHQLMQQEIFETELGYAFLSELRREILSDPAVNEEDVERILVKANKEQIGPKMAEDELPDEAAIAQLVERTKTIVKKYKERFYMLLVVVLILLGAVAFMFVITITSDSPTILNYKTKLENEYASWDEDLQKREDEVKHKEEELLKKAGQQQDNASEDK